MISLRRSVPEDRALLIEIYASSRAHELAGLPWPAEQRDAFVAQQYDAQDRSYRAQFSEANFDVIEENGTPVGRLYVARSAAEIRIVDIAILPHCSGRGVGTMLLRDLLAEAATAGKAVTLTVGQHNRAQTLYRRLGFVEMQSDAVYMAMEWRPVSC